MSKAEKIAKEIALAEKKRQSKPCKHGLTHRTCAYCQGYPISNYPSSVGLTHIRSK